MRFYCDALGCAVDRRRDDIGLIQLRAGSALIDLVPVSGKLGRAGGPAPGPEGRNLDHFCLRIDPFDGEAIREQLARHGYQAGPVERRYGAEGDGPSIYVTDPEGNVVELKGPPDDRPARVTTAAANPVDTGIRPARPGDAAEIARLAAELGYPVSPGEVARRLGVLLPDPRHHVAVAAAGDRLLGWMHVERRCSLEGGDCGELVGLVVDATSRRLGTGRKLVDVAEEWVGAQGLAAIRVRSNVSRGQSHPFYESLGYSRSKTQHVYVKRVGPG